MAAATGVSNSPTRITHPSIHRGPADRNSRLPLQSRALTIRRQMIAVFGNDGVDHHAVTYQALVDDPYRQWGCTHAFDTRPAGSLLAAGHPPTVTRGPP